MSSKALRKLGISGIDDREFPPTNGVLVRLTPDQYLKVKKALQPILAELGDSGFWRAGGAGSFDPEHKFAKKGTRKIDSGDVDVFLDTDLLKKGLKLDSSLDDAAVRKQVHALMAQQFPATQIGKNVHIGFPMGTDIETAAGSLPAYFQIDLMVMEHAHEIGLHHEHDYSVKDSPFTGQDQQLAMSSLANTAPGYPPKTLQYNGMGGSLQNRATGEVITRDLDKIAEILLGPGHSSEDFRNVESIIDAVGGLDSPRLAQFKNDLDKKAASKSKTTTTEWFRNLMNRLNEEASSVQNIPERSVDNQISSLRKKTNTYTDSETHELDNMLRIAKLK